MQLSKHFTLDEMTFSQTAMRHGISNAPGNETIANLYRLTKHLENVREAIGKPMTITSGYRSPLLNRMVGGRNDSQHTRGCAVDFKVNGMTPDEAMCVIIDAGLPFDQLIREFDSWVHYSVPNAMDMPWRMQALIIDRLGVRPYPASEAAERPADKLNFFQRLFGG